MMKDRLKAAREKLYETAQAAAEAMGVNPSTYTQHENGTRGITVARARRYAKALGISVDYLVGGKVAVATQTVLEQPLGLRNVKSQSLTGIPIKGFVQAGIWQETYRPERELYLPLSQDVRQNGRVYFALEVRGESMNRRFSPGDHVICHEWKDTPVPGDVVVVERNRNGLFEATLKTVKMSAPDRIELWPDSTHPNFQSPLILNGSEQEDGETITIIAKVIGSYRSI